MRVRVPDSGLTGVAIPISYTVPCGLHKHFLRGVLGDMTVGAGSTQNAHLEVIDRANVRIWQCLSATFHGTGTNPRIQFGPFGYAAATSGFSETLGMGTVQVEEGDLIRLALSVDPTATWTGVILDFTDFQEDLGL